MNWRKLLGWIGVGLMAGSAATMGTLALYLPDELSTTIMAPLVVFLLIGMGILYFTLDD